MKKLLKSSLLSMVISACCSSHAAVVTVVDGLPGNPNGLSGITAAEPSLSNPGITLGAQRWFALQAAANRWGSILRSDVETRIAVSPDARVTARPRSTVANMAEVTPILLWPARAGGGYDFPIALANAISGRDLTPGEAHIAATFQDGSYSAQLGEGGLMNNALYAWGEGFGYGMGPTFDYTVAAFRTGIPYVTSAFAYASREGVLIDSIDHSALLADALRGDLLWSGTYGTLSYFDTQTERASQLEIVSPTGVLEFSDFDIVAANFGTPISADPGLRASVAIASNGPGGSFSDGCTPLTNGRLVSGRIAVIDRGDCTFHDKARNAQNAGAVGVLLVNNRADGLAVPSSPATADEITIPVVMTTQAQGEALKARLRSGVDFNLRLMRNEYALSGMHPYTYPRINSSLQFLVTPAYEASSTRPINPVFLGVLRDIGWQVNDLASVNRDPSISNLRVIRVDAAERSVRFDIADPDENNVLFITMAVRASVAIRATEVADASVKVFTVNDGTKNKVQLIGKVSALNRFVNSGGILVGSATPAVLDVIVSDPSGPVSLGQRIELPSP